MCKFQKCCIQGHFLIRLKQFKNDSYDHLIPGFVYLFLSQLHLERILSLYYLLQYKMFIDSSPGSSEYRSAVMLTGLPVTGLIHIISTKSELFCSYKLSRPTFWRHMSRSEKNIGTLTGILTMDHCNNIQQFYRQSFLVDTPQFSNLN